jgi:hypothetical protein
LIEVAAACSTSPPPDLKEIVALSVKAMGGNAALDGIESVFRQRNEHTFTLRKRPHFHLVVLLNEEGGVRYAEGYDGQVAWEILDDGPKVRVSERAQVALWHTTQFPGVLRPLSKMEDLGHEIRLAGMATLGSVEYYRILLRLSDGFEREYYLNARTYRVERARDARRLHAYENDIQPIESVWSDFRQVDGVWVPFTTGEVNFETGEPLSGGTMLDIRTNVEVPVEVFGLEGSLQPFLDVISGLRRKE